MKHATLQQFPRQDNKQGWIDMTPTQGEEGAVVTVIAQMPLPPAKLAFNSLLVNTQQMQVRNITTLVAVVPPFPHTRSPTSLVPVSICFLAKDTMVTETTFVADFLYTTTSSSSSSSNDKQKSSSTFVTHPLIQSMYSILYLSAVFDD